MFTDLKNWIWWKKFVAKAKGRKLKGHFHKALRLVRERMGW